MICWRVRGGAGAQGVWLLAVASLLFYFPTESESKVARSSSAICNATLAD